MNVPFLIFLNIFFLVRFFEESRRGIGDILKLSIPPSLLLEVLKEYFVMSYMRDTSSICCWLSGMTRAGQRKEEEDKKVPGGL